MRVMWLREVKEFSPRTKVSGSLPDAAAYSQLLKSMEMLVKPLILTLSSPLNSTLPPGTPITNTPIKLQPIRQDRLSELRNSSIRLEWDINPTAFGGKLILPSPDGHWIPASSGRSKQERECSASSGRGHCISLWSLSRYHESVHSLLG